MRTSGSMLRKAGQRDPFADGDFTAVGKPLRDMPMHNMSATDEGLTAELRDRPAGTIARNVGGVPVRVPGPR
jgi:hypothetical protein